MERHTLLETELYFTDLLSIRSCKVLSKLSREMFSLRESCTNLQTSTIPHCQTFFKISQQEKKIRTTNITYAN